MDTPTMTPAEARQQATFSALMWALSYPGQPRRLPAAGLAAFALIGETLVDLEASYFSPDPELAALLAHTGGRALPPAQAAYQLYPLLDATAFGLLAQAPTGTYRDPDLGATLVIGCALGEGPALALSGPGIVRPLSLRAGRLPAGLWKLRARAVYPLGWDLLLVSGDQVIGLPRTTVVEVR